MSDREPARNGNGIARVAVSVVVPVFDEQESLGPLHADICKAMEGHDFEVLYVDDGSRDRSAAILEGLAAEDPRVRVLHFRRNYGQTAAIAAGLDHARGAVFVLIDADRQNDPEDIPRLLEELRRGYDVVSGWRRDRQDAPLTRVVPSKLANLLISWISGVRLHDYGCTLKVYRREVMEGVRLYGEMHRFIPIYASWQGARIAELPVQHHPRRAGTSKYGLRRTYRVILDLVVVKFLDSYSTKPIHVFGGFGLVCFVVAAAAAVFALWLKFFADPPRSLIETPLPLLTVLMTVLGFLSILMGLLAELVIRTYYESQDRRTYVLSHGSGVGTTQRKGPNTRNSPPE